MASLKWAEYRVVPDVIKTAPAHEAEIVYQSGVKVDLGNELTPTQVKDMPLITFPAEEGALYTILMTDPDANPARAEVHHLMVINVSGGDSRNGTIHSEYVGAGAPKGSGFHRYVFAIYKQPDNWQPRDAYRPKNRERRYNFSMQRFAEENNFGDPVAGNFFRAQYDDWVPIQRAQMEAATPK